MRRLFLLLASAVVALGSPAPAGAVGGATGEVGEAEEAEGSFPLGAMVILDQSVGAGTFLANEFERRPSYTMTLSFFPMWRVTDNLTLRGRLDVSKELVASASSETTKKGETQIFDTMLTALYRSFYAVPEDVSVVGGLNVGGMFDLILPTSKQSQFRTLIMGVRPALVVTWPLGPVSIQYMLRVTKNFNQYTSPVVDVSADQPVALARLRGNEEVAADLIAVGGNNVEWSVANRLTVPWDIGATFGWGTELVLTVDYMLSHSWTYRSYPDDELAAANALAGRGQRDVEMGTIEVSWGVIKHLYLALGVTSYQPPKTADNEGFRVPFLNFADLAGNYTSLYFDVIGVF